MNKTSILKPSQALAERYWSLKQKERSVTMVPPAGAGARQERGSPGPGAEHLVTLIPLTGTWIEAGTCHRLAPGERRQSVRTGHGCCAGVTTKPASFQPPTDPHPPSDTDAERAAQVWKHSLQGPLLSTFVCPRHPRTASEVCSVSPDREAELQGKSVQTHEGRSGALPAGHVARPPAEPHLRSAKCALSTLGKLLTSLGHTVCLGH